MASILKAGAAALALFFSAPVFAQDGNAPLSANACILNLMNEINLARRDNVEMPERNWVALAQDRLASGDITPEMAKAIEAADKLRPLFSSRVIYSVISDELVERGYKTSRDIKTILTTFSTALPESEQLRLVDAIVERLSVGINDSVTLENLKDVARDAKRFNMSVDEYTRFLYQWRKLKESDYDEATLAIYMNLLESSGSKQGSQGMTVSATVSSGNLIDEVAKERSAIQRLKKYFSNLQSSKVHIPKIPKPSVNQNSASLYDLATNNSNAPFKNDKLIQFYNDAAGRSIVGYFLSKNMDNFTAQQILDALKYVRPPTAPSEVIDKLSARIKFFRALVDQKEIILRLENRITQLNSNLARLGIDSESVKYGTFDISNYRQTVRDYSESKNLLHYLGEAQDRIKNGKSTLGSEDFMEVARLTANKITRAIGSDIFQSVYAEEAFMKIKALSQEVVLTESQIKELHALFERHAEVWDSQQFNRSADALRAAVKAPGWGRSTPLESVDEARQKLQSALEKANAELQTARKELEQLKTPTTSTPTLKRKSALDQLNAPNFSDDEAATPATLRQQTEQH